MIRRMLLIVCILGMLPLPVAAGDEHPALILVRETAEKILVALRAEREVVQKDNARLYALVDGIILPHFDFHEMSSWTLGKYWRKASRKQKDSFAQEFKMLLVRTYSKALVDNMDTKIDYIPVRAKDGAKDVVVKTEIPQSGGFPLPINYSMYLKGKDWKVYDVDIDGISMVKNYRTTFSKEIRSNGIDTLIKKLHDRNIEARDE